MVEGNNTEINRLVRRALDEFGVAADASTTFVNYRENHVFHVGAGLQEWALKLHRPGYRTDDEITSEAAILTSLAQAGVAVVEPATGPSGSHLVHVQGTDASAPFYQATLQRWISDARAIGDSAQIFEGHQRPDSTILRELGALMGKLHSHGEQDPLPEGYDRRAWDAPALVGPRALWGTASDLPTLTTAQRDILRDAEERLARDLTALDHDRTRFGPIHADLTVENVLRERDGLVLIDFDDSGEGWYLFDLATTYFFWSHHPDSAHMLADVVAGYEEEREITPAAAKSWHALLFARALSYLAWSVDRPGDPASMFHIEVLLPWILEAAQKFVTTGSTGWDDLATTSRPRERTTTEGNPMPASLQARRFDTLGPYTPLFYDQPLEFVSGSGVWLTDVHGDRYLDGYNNVPHVGHAHPRVVEAIARQAAELNIHTRYLNSRVVDYAEDLLATFDTPLDRVMFTNSGSESNDLAFRIANQHTGHSGIIVSDFSYHGHTRALAEVTTGLRAREALGSHVRTIRIPDLDGADMSRDEGDVLRDALAEIDAAIASLQAEGFGVSAVLFDSLFSTEGLNRLPDGYVSGLVARVRRAGGLAIGDEVQSGFGRTGHAFWGHQNHGVVPDLVTMGKPMANGHPVGGVVLSAALLDEFGPRNMYFNTFGGNPVSAAAGHAVLDIMRDEQLMPRSIDTSRLVRQRLEELRSRHPYLGPVKGTGLFFGLEIFDGPAHEASSSTDPARTKGLVERMRRAQVLISRIGPKDSVLKMRPPLAITSDEITILLDRFEHCVEEMDPARRA